MFPFGNFNGQTILDDQSFAPPTYGGAEAVKYASVTFTDTTAKSLFTLPKGAVITGWTVNVTTAFNGSGTDLLDIGTTDADAFANDLDLSATGQIVTGFIPAAMFTALTEDTVVTATYTDSAEDADAGAAVVCVRYILK